MDLTIRMMRLEIYKKEGVEVSSVGIRGQCQKIVSKDLAILINLSKWEMQLKIL